MTCGPQGNKSACEIGAVLADTGQHVYQWVYAGSMVSVLTFSVIKGFTFTKTTLMASSSLHDHVFDKVLLPGAACNSSHLANSISRAPMIHQALCWALGIDNAQGAYS